MSAIKLKDDIYSIGVLNPNMRVFDIIMKTDFGTSYNAYLVRGTNKTVVIESCHEDYGSEFLENINEVCNVDDIDCIILNHNEPDHTGSLLYLLNLNPKIEVITSQAGALYLKNITNIKDLKVNVVKTGDILDLGGKTLEFIIAPFLHWPDSMFTYLKEDKFLFSCDFLGCHYCEPYIIDKKVKFKNSYEEAFKGYYDAIFSPFPQYVRNGLDKIKDLEIDFVATSHGPVLTKGRLLEYAIEKYSLWCAGEPREQFIPIFYASAYGYTKKIAYAIADGIKEIYPDLHVELYDIIEHDMAFLSKKINTSTGFLIGSPTLNKIAVEPVWRLLSHIDTINNSRKPVAVFGSYGWSGEAVPLLNSYLQNIKFNVVLDGLKICFKPSEDDLQMAMEYGKDYARKMYA